MCPAFFLPVILDILNRGSRVLAFVFSAKKNPCIPIHEKEKTEALPVQ